MLGNIKKFKIDHNETFHFSILIPTWNNLGFLKNCLDSINKNSSLNIQPVIIVNEGSDGTCDWLLEHKKYDFIHAETNIGICYALNIGRSLVQSEYIVYANDDMYFLPDWDTALYQAIQSLHTNRFMLSATMIEPSYTGNKCVSVADFGSTLDDFDEKRLLETYTQYIKPDWHGSTWPPNVVHKDMWDLVGGLSIEFSPGMYSDPDFSMKLFQAGVRHFRGIGNSLVYHFGSKSTKRIKRNKGRNTFLMKWGITSNTFMHRFLHIGSLWDKVNHPKELSKKEIIINTIKRIFGAMRE